MKKEILYSVDKLIKEYEVEKNLNSGKYQLNPKKNHWVSIYPLFNEIDKSLPEKMSEFWLTKSSKSIAFLYFHIPFCMCRCDYCHFHTVSDLSLLQGYLESLEKESTEYLSKLERVAKVTHMYFGGGTPSIVSLQWLKRLIENVFTYIDKKSIEKTTIEVHPKYVKEELYGLAQSGHINRVSMGVQSFNRYIIDKNGRIFADFETVKKVCEGFRKVGIGDINIDFMVGLYRQQAVDIVEDINKIDELINLNLIDSITVYPRSYTENSQELDYDILDNIYLLNRFKSEILYREYFAKYVGWKEDPMYFYSKKKDKSHQPSSTISEPGTIPKFAFGNSAYSYFDDTNFRNSNNIHHYIKNITECGVSTQYCHTLTPREANRRYLIFGAKRGYFDCNVPYPLDEKEKVEMDNVINRLFELNLAKKNSERIELTLLGSLLVEWIEKQLNGLFEKK